MRLTAGVGDVEETTLELWEEVMRVNARGVFPEDVAQAALYLASDESRFVMGSGFVVDGGLTAGKS